MPIRNPLDECLARIESRFDLTLVAAKRARQLARGAEAKVPWDGHKSTVVALEEIAGGLVTATVLEEEDLPVATPPMPDVPAIDPWSEG